MRAILDPRSIGQSVAASHRAGRPARTLTATAITKLDPYSAFSSPGAARTMLAASSAHLSYWARANQLSTTPASSNTTAAI
jgi:hypothetical protein